MNLARKKQIADSVKDFFNTLPKDVVGVVYDLETKSVTVKFKRLEEPEPKTNKDIVELVKALHQELKHLELLLKLKAFLSKS